MLMFRFFVFFALASAHYQPIIGSNVLNRLHRAFRLSIDEVDYEIKGLSKGPLPLSPIYNCPDVYLAVCYCSFVIVTWPLCDFIADVIINISLDVGEASLAQS